jgi:hypothetical protein
MTQGNPVSWAEKQKIFELHENGYFPSIIARHISDKYPDWCGGYRSPETIRAVIKRGNRK